MSWTCRLHDLSTDRGTEPEGTGRDPRAAFEAALRDAALDPAAVDLQLEKEGDHWAVVEQVFGYTVGTVTYDFCRAHAVIFEVLKGGVG